MDYYSNEPFIGNFGGRVLLSVALAERTASDKRLWKLPITDLWALSLTIIGWCPAKLLTPNQQKTIEGAYRDTGLSEFYPALDLYSTVLGPFVGAAFAAESRPGLAQAAIYLDAAIERIGFEVLSAAMASSKFRRAAARLLSKFPLAPDLSKDYSAILQRQWDDPSPSPGPSPAQPRQSRQDRFERAELRPDRRVQPVPKLSRSEELAANLYLRGYTVEEIEAIKRGPKRS